jgi:hypothetical protein
VTTETEERRVPTPPRARNTSILPAAAILILAVVMLGAFGVVDVLLGASTTPTTLPTIIGGLRGGTSSVFKGDVIDGVPPANISSAFIAPDGTKYVATINTGGGGPLDYDLELQLSVDASRAKVLGFYNSDFDALGWNLFSSSGSASSTGTATLEYSKGGDDGSYWELGITATATSPRTTTFTYRIFQADDSS